MENLNSYVHSVSKQKTMTIEWIVSVENRFGAKVDRLIDWVLGIASYEDAKTIVKEIENEGLYASNIFIDDDCTYSLCWAEKISRSSLYELC